ncbi:hypothetical protein ACNRD9_07975, partial [Ralstonia pseudosolanacearum]|uniref:hypothetical protein n=1 Tax=Ralstonia pseudosolanacearum TaxID=1310165 RepID=UPI003AAEEF67
EKIRKIRDNSIENATPPIREASCFAHTENQLRWHLGAHSPNNSAFSPVRASECLYHQALYAKDYFSAEE